MLRAVAIGLAVGIGAYWGRRLAMLFGFSLLIVLPLKAQAVYYGDTASDKPGFLVDSTEFPKEVESLPLVGDLKAPKQWEYWFYEIAHCEGLPIPPFVYSKIRWHYVNARGFGRVGHGLMYTGYTLAESLDIFIALPRVGEEKITKHELLHILLDYAGIPPGHPMPFYARCGLTVQG